MLRLLLVLVVLAGTARAEVDVGGGVPRTAKAVRAAVKRHRLGGYVWLGKLRGVGGGRDTLVYIPSALDATRVIDVVVYMEGIGSFSDSAMESRHVASIAKLRGNFVYVAPDAPSSSHGVRASDNEHWQAGCADRECEGGVAAPGDFLVFLDEVRAKIAAATGEDVDLRVSLIGFSRGGKGVLRALEELASVKFEVGGKPIAIGDVIYADGNYLDDALDGAWAILATRPEAPRMTILVGSGEFSEDESGDGNRRRALAFWKAVAPEAPLPTATHATSAGRLRLIPVRADHFTIGDRAVDFLGHAE
jgi:hypothetical protein